MSFLRYLPQETLALYIVGDLFDQQTARDVVQETFLRVYRKRKEYKAIAHFSTWLFTIAGNLAKSELRRRKRYRPSGRPRCCVRWAKSCLRRLMCEA